MPEEPEVVDDPKEAVFSKHSMMDGPMDSQNMTPYLRPATSSSWEKPQHRGGEMSTVS